MQVIEREHSGPTDAGSALGARAAGPWQAVVWCVAVGLVVFGVSFPRALYRASMEPFLWGGAVSIAVATLVTRRRPRVRRPPLTLCLFGVVALMSLTWTTSADDTWSALGLYGAIALLALALESMTSRTELVGGVAVGLLLIVVASLAAIPWESLHPFVSAGPGRTMTMFQGVYRHWNILSYTICLTLPALLALPARTLRARVVRIFLVLAVLIVLVKVRSASGLVTAVAITVMAAALAGFKVVNARQRYARRGYVVVCLAIGAALLIVGGLQVSTLLKKDVTTLSGRIPLWNAIARVSSEHPWEGFGFGAVWDYHWLRTGGSPTRDAVNALIPYPLGHGHNGLMDLVIQVGIVGVLAYVAILLTIASRSARMFVAGMEPVATWSLLTLATLIFLGFTEPLWMVPLGWFLVVAMASAARRQGSRLPAPASMPRHLEKLR